LSEPIQKSELKERGIYRIRSRNLDFGVYDGNEGFIGIRQKFDSRYLFTEYLSRSWGGTKIPFDTVTALEQVGSVDESIALKEVLGSVCESCGKRAWWTGPPGPAPWACENNCDDVRSYAKANRELFAVMDEAEKLPHKERDEMLAEWEAWQKTRDKEEA
jgi:hypothetical protein